MGKQLRVFLQAFGTQQPQFSKCSGTRAVPLSPYRPHSVRPTGRIYYLHLLCESFSQAQSISGSGSVQPPPCCTGSRGEEQKHCCNYNQVMEKDVESVRDYLPLIECSCCEAAASLATSRSCKEENLEPRAGCAYSVQAALIK